MRAEAAAPRPLRCAIYTRKSSEEGLDQAFNSLHAQREACEAYIKSQAHEGWRLIATPYDDGGFSGGTLERPALRQLLADIDADRIDVVVVYKVDRLTRALADFAKIVERLDAANASFVSVTQAFNTTTSMGRLTLNVLLSFAQFEREVTGERIRDKIAASKAKGMWMGGIPPLGYDKPVNQATRALRVNCAEAGTVRLIFDQYLKLGSVRLLQPWLEGEGIGSKRWVTNSGRRVGGAIFARGALFHLLKNRHYLGEITHKGRTYPGAHQPIVDQATFDEVQRRLVGAARRHKERPTRTASQLLTGLIFDADGDPMSPTFTRKTKGGRLYRYYVSAPLQQGQVCGGEDAIRRVPAEAIETFVSSAVSRIAGAPPEAIDLTSVRRFLHRVEVHPTSVQVVLARAELFVRKSDRRQQLATLARRLDLSETIEVEPGDPERFRLTAPCRMKLRGGRTWLTAPDGRNLCAPTRTDPSLLSALRSAHSLIRRLSESEVDSPDAAKLIKAPANAYDRKLIRLAFLAPEIQREIVEGRQPPGLNLERLMRADIPAAWDDQRALV